MAGFVLSAGVFPAGTTVNVYARPALEGGTLGSSVTSATTASDWTTTFTGLSYLTRYVAVGTVNSVERRVGFEVGADPAESLSGVATRVAALESSQATQDTSISTIQAALPVVTANAQTGDYTLVLGDAGKCIDLTAATGKTVTVPANASVAFPVGTVVEVAQLGAGQVTIAAAGGVTVSEPDSKLKTAKQYAVVALRKTATNVWVLSGYTAA